VAVLLASAAGCGGGADQLAPVQGRVFFRGRPLTGGTIVFVPDPERGGRGPLALGEIGPDGHYHLLSDGRHGAVPGWHRITVAGSDAEMPLPRSYSDPERSGKSCEVKAGRANVIDIQLD
jgi:hypothetical protein